MCTVASAVRSILNTQLKRKTNQKIPQPVQVVRKKLHRHCIDTQIMASIRCTHTHAPTHLCTPTHLHTQNGNKKYRTIGKTKADWTTAQGLPTRLRLRLTPGLVGVGKKEGGGCAPKTCTKTKLIHKSPDQEAVEEVEKCSQTGAQTN